jgi:hypothetical protein
MVPYGQVRKCLVEIEEAKQNMTLRYEYLALQQEHLALQQEHLALQKEYLALQQDYLALLEKNHRQETEEGVFDD